ncbi:hypothetical protein GTA08_BOTSDO03884 [Neofusicoccum parvum]|uniref:Uncharacterized protein n=1 Tax=Botryosphaeria parva (strain UCR-NP2) TaxID=1287680 RepID=R1GKP9_BOTPV|nr:hypothetical protein UCRNP2_6738 [Neofusicoccum parvum UCRNP2]GME31123.1 hypothetical protein GTA08_BOTSDO03884 [Neofusicoccum parvum]
MAPLSILSLATVSLYALSTRAGPVEKRQGGMTCPTCPLGGNPLVKLGKELIGGDSQSHTNCRWESVFGLTEDLGGYPNDERSFHNMLRVNYNEETNQCAVEAKTNAMADDNIYCVQGDCGVSFADDRSAVVRWGVCMLKNTADPAAVSALVEGENCVPCQGEVTFARGHDSDHCDGSRMGVATLGGKDISEMAPREGKRGDGFFWGGNVMHCSGLKG